ncbi:hypothetical protein CKA32_006649 [Geitlerinema sp. FC II]|nr:hypothetical protein CKA32_006649 [Geitlerinema sp. FC II]
MGLFEDFSKFLETRLEEFLQANPHLELQALEEQLREQEEDTLRLIADLKAKQKQLEDKILETAQDIQRWHIRIDKADKAGRQDLATAARDREAVLLRQGNQLWGQMQGVKDRLAKAQELQKQIQTRRQEVHAKAAEINAQRAQAAASQSWNIPGWDEAANYRFQNNPADPLEQVFQKWETDEELEQLKRNMGK